MQPLGAVMATVLCVAIAVYLGGVGGPVGAKKDSEVGPVESVDAVLRDPELQRLAADVPSKDAGSLLELFARYTISWSTSSTPAPVTRATVLAKSVLSRNLQLPGVPGIARANSTYREYVPLPTVRRVIEEPLLHGMKSLCESEAGCDVNQADPLFRVTPLHLAEFYGASEVTKYLLSKGANPDAMDTVGRKPSNMSFARFRQNSRKWARAAGRACEVPEVSIPSHPSSDDADTTHALAEFRRLVGEGEPVILRNARSYVEQVLKRNMQYGTAAELVEEHGKMPVRVASVPYAGNFAVEEETMTLQQYYDRFVVGLRGTTHKEAPAGARPPYVFQHHLQATIGAFNYFRVLLKAAAPLHSTGSALPLICLPEIAVGEFQDTQFYMGSRWSGAPHHTHSSAINMLLSGEKRWWVYPPRESVFSRKHAAAWMEDDLPAMRPEDRPLECVQREGDLFFVPDDWGHAAINLEDDIFGYTMELTDRRATLATLDEHDCPQVDE